MVKETQQHWAELRIVFINDQSRKENLSLINRKMMWRGRRALHKVLIKSQGDSRNSFINSTRTWSELLVLEFSESTVIWESLRFDFYKVNCKWGLDINFLFSNDNLKHISRIEVFDLHVGISFIHYTKCFTSRSLYLIADRNGRMKIFFPFFSFFFFFIFVLPSFFSPFR